MPTYHGSCHCGAVKFEIDADITELTRCTCTICTKKGGLYFRVSPDHFRLLQGEDALDHYRYNTKIGEHSYCRHCGIHTFGHPRRAPDMHLVNARSLDDFDLDAGGYEVVLFDGLNWDAAFAASQDNK